MTNRRPVFCIGPSDDAISAVVLGAGRGCPIMMMEKDFTPASADPDRAAELEMIRSKIEQTMITGTSLTINPRRHAKEIREAKIIESRKYEPTRDRSANAAPMNKTRQKNRKKAKAAKAARKAQR